MRDLPQIDVKGLTAADVSSFPKACVISVPTASLKTEVEEGAQRELLKRQHKKAREVYANFQAAHFKVPNGVYKDGHIVLLDGMMTAAVALALGIPEIPVFVVDLPDLADRARAFVSHSTDRTPATPGQLWRGQMTAGDEGALAIKHVCDGADVECLPYAPAKSEFKPRQTIAIVGIRRMIEAYGAENATAALRVCGDTGQTPIPAELMRVVSTLMFDPDYAGQLEGEQIAAILADLGPRAYTEARALAAAKRIPTWRGLVAVVNRAKRPKPKVSFDPEPDRFEGSAEVVALSPNKETAPLPRPSPTARRVIDRRPRDPVALGDPEPGRSALDERRRAQV